MTKEGLILLRNNLQKVKEEEKYNLVQCWGKYGDNFRIGYFQSKGMIIELAKYNMWQNELEALNYLEEILEKSLSNAYIIRNNVESITSKITVYFLASNKFITNLKYDNNKFLVSNKMDKDELLTPYVSIIFSNYIDDLYDKQPEKNKSFIVNYDVFCKILKIHGFEISIDNFDDLLENHINQVSPEIVLDFDKEKVKTK